MATQKENSISEQLLKNHIEDLSEKEKNILYEINYLETNNNIILQEAYSLLKIKLQDIQYDIKKATDEYNSLYSQKSESNSKKDEKNSNTTIEPELAIIDINIQNDNTSRKVHTPNSWANGSDSESDSESDLEETQTENIKGSISISKENSEENPKFIATVFSVTSKGPLFNVETSDGEKILHRGNLNQQVFKFLDGKYELPGGPLKKGDKIYVKLSDDNSSNVVWYDNTAKYKATVTSYVEFTENGTIIRNIPLLEVKDEWDRIIVSDCTFGLNKKRNGAWLPKEYSELVIGTEIFVQLNNEKNGDKNRVFFKSFVKQ